MRYNELLTGDEYRKSGFTDILYYKSADMASLLATKRSLENNVAKMRRRLMAGDKELKVLNKFIEDLQEIDHGFMQIHT